jgi:hypothetical protein
VRGQEQDGNVQQRAQPFGRLHAVDPAFELNVHEHQVGAASDGHADRLLTRAGLAHDHVALGCKAFTDLDGDRLVVLDDQNSLLCQSTPRDWLDLKRSAVPIAQRQGVPRVGKVRSPSLPGRVWSVAG